MTTKEINAISTGVTIFEGSKLSSKLTRKEFNIYLYMKRCLKMNVRPTQKECNLFAKMAKKHMKLQK